MDHCFVPWLDLLSSCILMHRGKGPGSSRQGPALCVALIAEFWRNLMPPTHQLIGHFPRSSPRISLHLQGSWFLWCRKICSKQDLGAGCEHCSLGVPASGVPADGESVCPGPQSSCLVLPSACASPPSCLKPGSHGAASKPSGPRAGVEPSQAGMLASPCAKPPWERNWLLSFLNCGPSSGLRLAGWPRPKLQLQVWPINI